MTVGAIASYADVNSILAAGRADLCVLARAHLYDPYWTHHAAREQGIELPWPDQVHAGARLHAAPGLGLLAPLLVTAVTPP